ncbi:MAG: hypothetical protein ACTS3R_04675 [Inquilinaceae bacterium]
MSGVNRLIVILAFAVATAAVAADHWASTRAPETPAAEPATP